MVHIAVLLRGHERDTFQSNRLNEFLNTLTNRFCNHEIIVCVHTWSETEATKSWRKLYKTPKKICESMIRDYFDIPIHIIHVDNENDIELIGNLNGNFGSMPILAWKRMWYGQFKAIDCISEYFSQFWEDPIVLNMRIDFFDCSTSRKYKLSEDSIFHRLELACKNSNEITFLKDAGEFDGIDNVIISKVSLMYMLLHHFYYNLDNIVLKYDFLLFHENAVYYEAQKIMGNHDFKLNRFQYLTSIAWNHMKTLQLSHNT